MGVAIAEFYIQRHINSSYLYDNDFVISFNTPLLLSYISCGGSSQTRLPELWLNIIFCV